MAITTKPPTWFWVVAALLLLWGLAGLASFAMHLSYDPNDPANPPYDNQLYKSLPAWLNWVYAVAVGTGFAGAVVLLARKREAAFLYAISLVAVIVQFGWTLGTTDLIAVKGFAVAAIFPIVIVGLAAFGLWFARLARGRGWIG